MNKLLKLIITLVFVSTCQARIIGLQYSADNNLYVLTSSGLKIYSPTMSILGSIKGNFFKAQALGIGREKEVYVCDAGNNAVIKYDKDGLVQEEWGTATASSRLSLPSGVAIDSKNNVFVSDTGNNCIRKFDGNGNLIKTFGKRGYGNSEFLNPYHIVIDKEDNLYVADIGNICVKKFNNSGGFLLKISENLKSLSDVSVDADLNIYIPDFKDRNVKVFNKNGAFLRIFNKKEEYFKPVCVAAGTDLRLAIIDDSRNILKIVDKNNEFISQGVGEYRFVYDRSRNLFDCAVNKDGEIFAMFEGKYSYAVFDSEGELLEKFGYEGEAEGMFDRPRGLAVDKNDRIFVADLYNSRIQAFNREGAFQLMITDVSYPMYLAFDKNNVLYVSDTDSGTIKKFTADGKYLDSILVNDYFNPGVLCVGEDLNIYVLNTLDWKLYVIGADKKLLNSFDLELELPHSIAVDKNKNIYIFEKGPGKIKKIKDGKLIDTFNAGSKDGAIYIYKNQLCFFNGSSVKKFELGK